MHDYKIATFIGWQTAATQGYDKGFQDWYDSLFGKKEEKRKVGNFLSIEQMEVMMEKAKDVLDMTIRERMEVINAE